MKLGSYDAYFDGDPLVAGETLEERLKNLEAMGFVGVQFCSRSEALGWPALKEAMAKTNLQVALAGGSGGLLSGTPEARQDALERAKAGLHLAAELGSIGWVIVATARREPQIPAPAPPKTLYEVQREMLIDQLAQLAPVADDTGTLIVLEPLNRYESHFLKQLEQAADICKAVGSPSVKLMADFFHMNIEEADIGEAIEGCREYLAYVHLADSNRCQPGAGHLDFRPGFAALKRIGYDGYMTLECRMVGEDKSRALAETVRFIRDTWAQV